MTAAWLAVAHDSHVETMDDHKAMVALLSRGDRVRARAQLLAEENGSDLSSAERPRRGGESEEPEGLA